MPPKNSRKSSQKLVFSPSRCSQVNAGSATILHGPSRWTYGVNTVQHGSPRSGSPSRSSKVHHGGFRHVKNHRKDPRFIQVHQASSRSITVALRFNPRYSPVHPGPSNSDTATGCGCVWGCAGVRAGTCERVFVRTRVRASVHAFVRVCLQYLTQADNDKKLNIILYFIQITHTDDSPQRVPG